MTTTQNADALHAGVTAADRALYGREHRVALASDPTVADLHALARDVERPTLLAEAADAEAEALRLLDRDAVIRRTYECEVTRGMLRFRVGEVVRVRVDAPRVGLPEDGKNLVILGLAETAASDRVRLVLWG